MREKKFRGKNFHSQTRNQANQICVPKTTYPVKHFDFWLILSLALALLVITPYELNAQGNDRDRRIRDHFGKGEMNRRDRRRSRERSPIEVQRFRTIGGTNNNPVGTYWGFAGADLRRLITPEYADGESAPSGTNRKPARSVSNYVSIQNYSMPNSRGMSSMVWQWGQFLDHDFSLTETAEPHEAFPIIVPTGDLQFDPFGAGGQTINLFRSEYRHGTNPRQQVNRITSWIDGSNVYGSDDATAASLRTLSDGLMKTSAGDLLPIDETGFFVAGDVRANEQVGLTCMHTIFVREHNRVARQIARDMPGMTDEQIYVRAKRHVSCLIQCITYQEFLPALMGPWEMRPYRGYNPAVYPNISNVFSTAAYRFGHSMLTTELLRLDNQGNEIPEGSLSLREAFFNPANLTDFGVDPYLKGLTLQQAQEVDTRIVDDVRNFLFGGPGSGGFDLAALNIQRGRDHGLPDFNTIRKYYGLRPCESFAEITSDPDLQVAMLNAFGTVDEIDAWAGMLAEDHLEGASIGETHYRIFCQQFEFLRDGDRFWFEKDLTRDELEVMRRTTLADVIRRNSGVRNLQPNVFFVPEVR